MNTLQSHISEALFSKKDFDATSKSDELIAEMFIENNLAVMRGFGYEKFQSASQFKEKYGYELKNGALRLFTTKGPSGDFWVEIRNVHADWSNEFPFYLDFSEAAADIDGYFFEAFGGKSFKGIFKLDAPGVDMDGQAVSIRIHNSKNLQSLDDLEFSNIYELYIMNSHMDHLSVITQSNVFIENSNFLSIDKIKSIEGKIHIKNSVIISSIGLLQTSIDDILIIETTLPKSVRGMQLISQKNTIQLEDAVKSLAGAEIKCEKFLMTTENSPFAATFEKSNIQCNKLNISGLKLNNFKGVPTCNSYYMHHCIILSFEGMPKECDYFGVEFCDVDLNNVGSWDNIPEAHRGFRWQHNGRKHAPIDFISAMRSKQRHAQITFD